MEKTLIKNGRVFDGERFFYADVLTNGARVERIAPHITAEKAYVYDATGQTVSAGLVDIHAHLRVKPTDKFGIQAEMSCFPFGVTAAADAGRLGGSREVMDSFMLKNVVLVKARICDNRAELDATREALVRFGDRVAGIKVYFDTSDGEVRDITPLVSICEFAAEQGLRVMVHCSHSPTPMADVVDVLREGDILTHAYHGKEHSAAEDGFACLKRARARGVIIDAGLAGHVHTDFGIFRDAIAAGALPDTIGTDITKLSAFVRGGRYGMTMCMSIAQHLGMSEEAVFRAVTSAPAKALGRANEWGTLREGGAADIAVIAHTDEGFLLTDAAGNRIESKNGYRCVLTLCDGQIVYKD